MDEAPVSQIETDVSDALCALLALRPTEEEQVTRPKLGKVLPGIDRFALQRLLAGVPVQLYSVHSEYGLSKP